MTTIQPPLQQDPTLLGQTILIFAGPDFEDRELFYPLYRFKEAGANVSVAGIGEASYKGKYGVPVSVDLQAEAALKQAQTKPWDAVIVPGGWAPDKIRMNQAALDIVKASLNANKIVASICHGGWVLSSANVLKGRVVTSYCAIKDDMTHAGAQWRDDAVVIDADNHAGQGTLITSRTPDDLPAFCAAIVQQLIQNAVTTRAAVQA
ncbi:MAG: type 1 glutamine amidotransferase domain-containing protein [Vampirovibrionales bacterium]|nr:type 1 glutamine amidotransferase domain-containing protein [Vampirovibrionales bacterium]